ncbi:MAG TPA: putative Ig domain-containing protein [Blastocatellia bacterium]
MRNSFRRRVVVSGLFLALASLVGVAGKSWLSRAQQPDPGEAARIAAPATVFNGGAITINTGTPPEIATPYPSTISVSGLTGTITKVTVTLTNFNHPFPDDVDMLLVGPTGEQALILSDVGGSTCANCPVTLTLDDAAGTALPNSNLPNPLASGTFRPSDYTSTPADSFPSPAPALGTNVALSVFNGTAPNGMWSLYVVDDGAGNAGTLGGWSLDISAAAGVCSITAPDNVTAAKDPNSCGALVSYPAPSTTGACNPITCTPPSGSYFPVGMTTVNCAEASPGAATASFTVTVTGSCPAGQICNNSPISISDSASSPTSASPYPSSIAISGLTGQVISKVTVTLANFSHSFPDKVDMLLVGPGGQNAILMSDVGGSTANAISPGLPVTLTLDDAAATVLPDTALLTTGSFQPANYNGGDLDAFNSPAPTPAGGSALSVFNGTDPNGTWSLYIVSDATSGADTGILASGWCLNITTTTPTPCSITQPANVMQAKDPDFCGAVVTYAAPATMGLCGAVICTPPAGSYFPLGLTTVNCAEASPGTASTSFTVTVTGSCPPGQSCNNNAITIGDGASAPIKATPYPSTINVSGLMQGISKVTVNLNNLSHSLPDNVDILLVGPGGQNAVILSDVGGSASNAISANSPVTLTLDDAAAMALPDNTALTTGKFRPANYNGGDGDPFPNSPVAPSGGSALSVFNGTDPNGTWSLYVTNDGTGQSGMIASGWCLNFTLSGTLTTLTLDPAFGEPNGQTVLKATLRETISNNPVSGQTISFTLNGNPAMPVATAVTDTNGVAMVMANIGNLALGTYPITATFNAANGFVFSTASNTLTLIGSPQLSKAFSPSSIQALGVSTLTITITNQTGNPVALMGVAFSDAFPAGVEVDTMPSATNTCGGVLSGATPGSTSISLANGTVGMSSSCTVSVQVKATTVGTKVNTISNLTTTNAGAAPPASATLSVTCPIITLGPANLPSAPAGSPYSQTLTASPAGGNYMFALTSGLLPAGLTLSPNGTISGTPTQSGTFNFRVTATGFGSCTAFYDYVLVTNCVTITLTPTSLPGGTVGAAYNQTVTASPAGTYSYSVSSGALPLGLSLNAATGEITGMPTTNGASSFTITATAGACTGSQNYSVTIGCPAISFTTASPLPPGSAGVAYSQMLNVMPAGSYTFSLVSGGLPSGLSLNPSTGIISGTPTATGTSTFTVKAQAAGGCNATQSYTLAIVCPAVTLSPATLPNGATGAAYSQTVSASPAGGNYTYVVTTGSLPAGLNLNPATGLLSGTPTANGSSTFRITATGFGGCTGFRDYTVVVGGGGCGTITLPASLPNGSVGQLYNAAATASPAGLYGYTVTSGSLPPGVTLFAANGLLFGFPTAMGSYVFTITATQGACSGSRMYTVVIGAGFASSLTVFSDFDGDGKSDLSVFRGSDGNWLVANSGDGQLQAAAWGAAYEPYNDVPVSGDYDGDGRTDLAVFRRGGDLAGYWFIKRSSDGGISNHFWGLPTDVPVPGDYDADGKTDVAVWRGSVGGWYVLRSSDGGVEGSLWGEAGDIPVPGDYDGDRKTDLAVFRKSIRPGEGGHWHIKRSSEGATITLEWGIETDIAVPGDYDGDGKTDLAVWRGSEGNWYIIESGSGALRTETLGALGDLPVAADYDGDGKADAAVWRASTSGWTVKQSSDGVETSKAHGQSGDVPVMARRN